MIIDVIAVVAALFLWPVALILGVGIASIIVIEIRELIDKWKRSSHD